MRKKKKKKKKKKVIRKKNIYLFFIFIIKKLINNVMIKTKSRNQNYVPNIIFFFLNCDFSCETKTIYQTKFFLQS